MGARFTEMRNDCKARLKIVFPSFRGFVEKRRNPEHMLDYSIMAKFALYVPGQNTLLQPHSTLSTVINSWNIVILKGEQLRLCIH